MSQGSWDREQVGAGCKQQQQPGRNVACVNNCGFFGNDTTLNMCPNCYRSHLSRNAESGISNPPVASDQLMAPASDILQLQEPSSPQKVLGVEIMSKGSEDVHIDSTDRGLLTRTGLVELSPGRESSSPFPRAQSDSGRDQGLVVDDQGSAVVLEAEVLKAEVAPTSLPSVKSVLPKPLATHGIPGVDAGLTATQPKLGGSASGNKPHRCNMCRKKVGLTGFRCRCDGLFCGSHRYSDKHECTYDYKSAGRDAIAKANPVVVADKIVRF